MTKPQKQARKPCPTCRGLKTVEVKGWGGKTEKVHCGTCAGRGWVAP